MTHSFLKNRMAALLAVIMLGIATALAQTNTVKHIVERGETLESIAEKYGVTKDDITRLNPDAAQFVYVGMEITIPAKTIKTEQEVKPINEQSASVSEPVYSKHSESTTKESVNASDFSHYGIGYRASFKAIDEGPYIIGGSFYAPSSPHTWGGDIMIGANYGLVDKDYAGVSFIIGPAYGYVVNKTILLATSLDFVGSWTSVQENPQDTKKSKDLSFGWGLVLNPKVVFNANKVKPFAGIDLNWSKGSKKITAGFFVGLGFNI